MSQGFDLGLVSAIMSYWGNGMSVDMVVASIVHHGSYRDHVASLVKRDNAVYKEC